MTEKNRTSNIYDTSIRLLFPAFIVAWCIMLIFPFDSIILWGVILALAFAPPAGGFWGDKKNKI